MWDFVLNVWIPYYGIGVNWIFSCSARIQDNKRALYLIEWLTVLSLHGLFFIFGSILSIWNLLKILFIWKKKTFSNCVHPFVYWNSVWNSVYWRWGGPIWAELNHVIFSFEKNFQWYTIFEFWCCWQWFSFVAWVSVIFHVILFILLSFL